jgi:hypothetical protein
MWARLKQLAGLVRARLPYRPRHHRPSWHTLLRRPDPQSRHDPETHSLNGGQSWHPGWPPEWKLDEDDDDDEPA